MSGFDLSVARLIAGKWKRLADLKKYENGVIGRSYVMEPTIFDGELCASQDVSGSDSMGVCMMY